MTRETTEIRIEEHGEETHESWLLVRANRVQSAPAASLFDSEIGHQRYVVVTVTRCIRKRTLSHDWLHGTKVLLEMAMSQAQWGAFVSSFGDGNGVPATLQFLNGPVAQAPRESRFDRSHAEVRASGEKGVEEIRRSYERVMEAFEAGGKRALRAALASMGHTIGNVPAGMEFAAQSLTEHVEAVVTKARADIEGMVLAAGDPQLAEAGRTPFELGPGECR